MKKLLAVLLGIATVLTLFAQKKVLDNESYKNWKELRDYNISNDGKYMWYRSGAEIGEAQFNIVSLGGVYRREFKEVYDIRFTADSRYVLFTAAEGFSVLQLKSGQLERIDSVSSFNVPEDGEGRFVTYTIGKRLVLKDLSTGKEKIYPDINNSIFNKSGTVLLLQKDSAIIWLDLAKKEEQIIATDGVPEQVCFDKTSRRISFLCKRNGINTLHYFERGMSGGKNLSNELRSQPDSRAVLTSDPLSFSPDGNFIYYKIQYTHPADRDSSVITSQIDIWNYRDQYLQSAQMRSEPPSQRRYTFCYSFRDSKIYPMEDREMILWGTPVNQYAVLKNRVNEDEAYWDKSKQPFYELLEINTQKRTRFIPADQSVINVFISPATRFVTWYDTTKGIPYCYDPINGKMYDLTKEIRVHSETHAESDLPIFTVGWLRDDQFVLVSNSYDIWMVDPLSKKPVVNITGDRSQFHLALQLVYDQETLSTLQAGDTVLLAALDEKNKNNGLIKARLKQGGMSTRYVLFPCVYYYGGLFSGEPSAPKKAKKANVYLVQRQNETEAPNIFATSDFISFQQLSDIHPQRDYNWLTTELIHYPMENGQEGTGILYRPENFDANKKYPIIFHYYEERSRELHQFQKPTLSEGQLSIAWYVSNGYLVFVPDIIKKRGEIGESARMSVVSAARYLGGKYGWIDSTKMGLQGHSYGGYETNYIVSHSNIFAAAQASAGPSDLVSNYGGLGFGQKSLAGMFENGQIILGTTPWQRPDIYIANSPLFFADKITTPLLLLHNKNDESVPFTQAVEFFTALRRLKKPVWLLQYNESEHTQFNPSDQLDFTIRQQQFFNHYLKSAPAPEWMTKGIGAHEKGLKSGLKLDAASIN